MYNREEIQQWYNQFTKAQTITGVNLRHYTIMNKLKSLGLRKDSSVLEIGCGIGTLTGLLANKVQKGKLIAADISDESVKIAQSQLKNQPHVEFIVTDMSDFSRKEHFDFIVLPDVMEHIPIEQHSKIFEVIANHIHENSIVLIHIPHPNAITYLREFEPEKMQVIDQALQADQLLTDAYKHNLELLEYRSYSLFDKTHDYVFITLKKHKKERLKPLTKNEIIKKKMVERLRYLFR